MAIHRSHRRRHHPPGAPLRRPAGKPITETDATV